MNVANSLVKILEENGVKHIFGHPGEQILPFYEALSKSSIEHILMRHEQGAAHAADAFSRSSDKLGVCISTGGPGALNLTMAVATAFKDNVPILVITGDNPTCTKNKDYFQSINISEIFKNITFKSFNPKNSKEALHDFNMAIEILNKSPKGPVHINLSKDILLGESPEYVKTVFNTDYNYENIEIAKNLIKKSKKPLIIAGAGIKYSKALDAFKKFVNDTNIPVCTTYQSKGIISEYEPLNLGLIGVRGSKLTEYALLNSDLIIALGSKLSERTIIDKSLIKNKLIHVNIDKDVLYGDYRIHGDVLRFLKEIQELNFKSTNKWLDDIHLNKDDLIIEGLDSNNLNPQIAIKNILDVFKNSIIVNDAGTHTTWTTIMSKLDESSKLIFSGSFAPMGYGLPGAIGCSIANPDSNVILINGDGGFQMNIQELATIFEYNLPITICILNNSELGIIRQYEEEFYNMKKYQVDLENPDFIAISNAYGIDSSKVKSENQLKIALKEAFKSKKPYLIEIIVDSENIPFPK